MQSRASIQSFPARKDGPTAAPCGFNCRHSEGEISMAQGDDQEGFLGVVTPSFQTN